MKGILSDLRAKEDNERGKMKEQSMNYCCDCDWAVKKGLFFKRWYCTNPQKNEEFGSHVFHPVTCKPVLKTPITCDLARFVGKEGATEQHAVNLKHPCSNYKGQLRGHPAIPPPATPLHEAPPMPERKAASFSEFLMGEVQKTKEAKEANEKIIYLKEENKRLKEAKEELLLILKRTCNLYRSSARCPEYVDECKHGSAQSCSTFRTIQKYDRKDGNK